MSRWLVLLVIFAGSSLGLTAQEKQANKTDKGQPTKPGGAVPGAKVRPEAVPGYTVKVIQGFTVLVSADTMREHEESTQERKPLDVLEIELKTITALFPPRPLTVLRNVLIWVEWEEELELPNGRAGNALAVYYGGHQLRLFRDGKHPLKAKNVTVLRMKSLTAEHQPKRDSGRCVLLHEIAHAVHDQLLGKDHVGVKAAYKQAMERKLFDPTQYAATNESEFFAEVTCAYFNQLNYHPRTRADLKKHDPVTFALLENLWGKRKDDAVASVKTSGSAATTRKLDDFDLGTSVLGRSVSKDELKGMPVALLLWNGVGGSSLAALTKFNTWHNELADFGLVTVGVHLTGETAVDVHKLAESRGVSYPITEARWVNGNIVSDFRDFPVCAVLDHEGRCVFQGPAFEAETPLREAVGAALLAVAARDEFTKELAPSVDALKKGKSPAGVLPKLAALTRSKDAETADPAKAILAKMLERGKQDLQEGEALVKEDPVAAYIKLERLPAVYKDTIVGVRANELVTKLKQDRAVATELRARTSMTVIKRLDSELSSRPGAFDPAQEKFRRDNGPLLLQLQVAIAQLRKAFPNTRSAEEADRIGRKYGVPGQ